MDATAWTVVGAAIAILVAIGASFRAEGSGTNADAPCHRDPGRDRRVVPEFA
jgi:hypothetical protein